MAWLRGNYHLYPMECNRHVFLTNDGTSFLPCCCSIIASDAVFVLINDTTFIYATVCYTFTNYLEASEPK